MKKIKIALPILYFVCSNIIFTHCSTPQRQKVEVKSSEASSRTPLPPGWVDTSKTLRERKLIDYVATAKRVRPNPKNGIPFATLKYDKLIAYDFAGSEEPYPSVIDKEGKFVPVVLRQQYLTQQQADEILSTLSKKSTYGEPTAACFNPHLALVFYKDDRPINQVNICLSCNYLIADIEIPAETHKKVDPGTENEYALTGFTMQGKNAIINLCRQINFTYGQ